MFKTCYFENLSPVQQEAVNADNRKRMLETRKGIAERFDPESVWYTKMEYINNFQLNPKLIYEVCECGAVLTLQKVIYDIPGECGSRKVKYNCRCGKNHLVIG